MSETEITYDSPEKLLSGHLEVLLKLGKENFTEIKVVRRLDGREVEVSVKLPDCREGDGHV